MRCGRAWSFLIAAFLVAAFLSPSPCRAASVLAVFFTFSRSHFTVFEPLAARLVARGHRLTMVSPYPLAGPGPPGRYEHVDISGAKPLFNGTWSLDAFPRIPPGFRTVLSIVADQAAEEEAVLRLPEVRALLASDRKFDLVLVEQFTADLFAAFAGRFAAPLVLFASCPSVPWAAGRLGVPHHPAVAPNLFSGFTARMDLNQRLVNLLQVAYAKLYHRLVLSKISDEAAERHFGPGAAPPSRLAEGASLLLVNSHFSLLPAAAPYPPAVVEVGGIHVMEPNNLDQDLDKWMNESSAGVVYFSFGSMLRGATLPADKVKAFLTVFGTLPQRVLWKWEDDAVAADRLPANVKIMKWLPQRDVLAHPNVRAFISHGGLLGTTEAVVSGVPVLGIPMYGDQPNNVAALVERGVAVHVDYNNISVASLTYALDALLNDNSYSENAKGLSARFLDRPMSPLDTAVYWTEYVIRHRGAPHLQSAAVHLAWYQYYLLDVLALFLLAVFLTLATIYYTLRSCLRLVVPSKSTKLKSN